MKGMNRSSSLAFVMAAVFGGSATTPKLSNKQLSIADGEYQKVKGRGIGSLNQRQKRKLVRQNPHMRKKLL